MKPERHHRKCDRAVDLTVPGWARRRAMRAIMAHKIMASWLAGRRS